MTDADKLYIDNLKAALQQIQRYIVLGLGAALYYMVLSSPNQDASKPVAIPMPGISIATDVEFAKDISLAIVFVVGAMASYSAERASRIATEMSNRVARETGVLEIFCALRSFPSIATEPYPLVRVGAALLPAVLIVFGRLDEVWNTEGSVDWFRFLFATSLLLAPYLALASLLWSPQYAEPQPPKLRLGRKNEKENALCDKPDSVERDDEV